LAFLEFLNVLWSWERFRASYETAVTECFAEGVSSPACLELESTYSHLLESLIHHAPGDGNRKHLWEPILQLGIAVVEGTPPAAIVAPWHPMRLSGTAVKVRQACGLINHLLTAETVDFGDARLFFDDLTEELGHPYYPEVCLGLHGTQPVLLACSDALAGYSLMEPPTVYSDDDDATNENATDTAKQILDLVQRYLSLQPHESANLSIALYNCNSARLPEAAVNMLGNLYEDDEEVRCQVILRHHNAERLHELYEKILEGSEDDVDSFVASEASRDFMARLRIGIMADSAPIPNAQDGPPIDIVFLQDVIARLADPVWLTEPNDAQVPEMLHHVPPRCSRRRPGTTDDLRSVMYLTSPVQPAVGWRYLQALYSVMQSVDIDSAVRPVPARQISFQNNLTRTIFDEVHRLGQWVVNYDDLLTRRQLRNQGVQIIRYQQHPHGGRNMTISSRAPLNLLEVLVQRRLYSLNLDLDGNDLRDLTRRMVDDANTISGDIVLRAAKRGQFASELIGLVLSRFLLQDELGNPACCGWYFLDDYAMWLGQREERLADILALSPQRLGDQVVLLALISEAKYVGRDALADARRSSGVQLRETVLRMQEALFGNPSRLDRDLWLSRLADILLDGIEIPATDGNTLHQWRDSIRNGTAPLLLKGYSHVFVHSQQSDASDPSERVPLANVNHAWQEIYGRDHVRQLVLAYHRHESPRPIRAAISDDTPWDAGAPTPPSARVIWTAVPRNSQVQQPDIPAETVPSAISPIPAVSTTPTSRPRRPTPVAAPPSSSAPLPAGTMTLVMEADPLPPRSSDQHAVVPSPDFAWAGADSQRVLSGLTPGDPVAAEDQSWLMSEVSRLRAALLSYGLQARVLGSRLTPNAALVRLQGSDRLRVSDIESRREELLTTHGLHITNVLAEPGQVVVSVARPHRQVVNLIDIWRNRALDPCRERSNQMLVVGVRESNGETLYLCPENVHAPHTLIAGTTGSGKSVLIQNLLLDIAITNDCANARIILIDPKQGADYLDLRPLQHIHEGIITTQDQARVALEWAVEEMDRRYSLFHTAGVANLVRYNGQVPSEQRLPRIWLFHDEFAVWMLTDDYKEMVSNTVQRLGVMARAAGIFLIFAAQRPEDRVMPLQLRDNLGNRLVLRVESPGTSKIALGEEGADRLLGKGQLAARLPSEDRIILAQVPILTPEQIRGIIATISRATVGRHSPSV
jgi:S-DNA-T family DNA segregation ATPase FtsK/SpoIIIE